MPSGKHIMFVAAATIVTMYAIRYLRASNSSTAQIIATIWPAQVATAPQTGAGQVM